MDDAVQTHISDSGPSRKRLRHETDDAVEELEPLAERIRRAVYCQIARMTNPRSWGDVPTTAFPVIAAEQQMDAAREAENQARDMYTTAQVNSSEAAPAAMVLKEALRQAVCKTRLSTNLFADAAAAAVQASAARNARAERHAQACAEAYEADERKLASAVKPTDEVQSWQSLSERSTFITDQSSADLANTKVTRTFTNNTVRTPTEQCIRI